MIVSERVERWKAAWESSELERIVALYAPDAEHSSRLVPQLYAEIRSETLRGSDQIREYVKRGRLWFVKVRIEVISLLESDDRSAVEYRRHSNLDATPAHVIELIAWQDRLIRSATVFHL